MGSKTANHHTLRMWLQGISICFLFFTLVRADPVPDFQVVGSDGDHHHHHHHDHHHEEHHDHHEEKEPLLDSYGAPIAAPSSDVATSNFDSIDSYGAPIAEEIKEVKKCELVRSTTKRSAECFLEPECENKCEDKSKTVCTPKKEKKCQPGAPICNTLNEEVCETKTETQYVNKCNTITEHKCETKYGNVPEQSCKVVNEQKCENIVVPECVDTQRQVCRTVYDDKLQKQCRTTTVQECKAIQKTVIDKKIETVYDNKCKNVPTQECETVTVYKPEVEKDKECKTIQKKKCNDVEKTVFDKKCKN